MRDLTNRSRHTKQEGRELAERHAKILNAYPSAADVPQSVYDSLIETADRCYDEAEKSYWYWLEKLCKE